MLHLDEVKLKCCSVVSWLIALQVVMEEEEEGKEEEKGEKEDDDL